MDNEFNFSISFLENNKTEALVDAARTLSLYATLIGQMADEITEMRIALRDKDEQLKAKDAEIQTVKYNAQRQIDHADQQVIMLRKRFESELNNNNNKEEGEEENA